MAEAASTSTMRDLAHRLAAAAAAGGDGALRASLDDVRELAACGALQRPALVAGLCSAAPQLSPLALVRLAAGACGVLGLQLLRALLPSPTAACRALHLAAASQEVALALLHPGDCCSAPAAVARLLAALLAHALDAGEPGAQQLLGHHHGSSDGSGSQELDSYVAQLVQQLQAAAARQEALAVLLFRAAAACAARGSRAAARWMQQQLQRQLQGVLLPAPQRAGGAAPPADAAAAQDDAAALALQSWAATAVAPHCWQLLLPSVLGCLTAEQLCRELQGCLSPGAGLYDSAAGAAAVRSVLLDLCGQGHAAAVQQMLTDALGAALAGGDASALLPPLLAAGEVFACGSDAAPQAASYEAVLAAGCAGLAQDSHAAGWPALLKALNLLMPYSSREALQAQERVLGALRPSVGALLQADIARSTAALRDVQQQRQQLQKLGQQQQQGVGAATKLELELTRHQQLLNDFQALPPGPDGRRHFTENMVNMWKLWRASASAQRLADAFTQQPPETHARARLALDYIQELQAHKLCRPGQAQAYRAACEDCGIHLEAPPQAAAAAVAAAGPLTAIEQLLGRLPDVVAAESGSRMQLLLTRIQRQLQQLLGSEQAAQQPGLQPPPAKRQHTGHGGSGNSSGTALAAAAPAGSQQRALQEQLLASLLAAYQGAAPGKPLEVGVTWRLAFLRLLADTPCLHEALLARLLHSMAGGGGGGDDDAEPDAVVAQAEALQHGTLAGLMSACRLTPVVLLQRGSGALVCQADVATGLFTWRGAAGECGGSLTGCGLVQHLLSQTRCGGAQERCCAASFWVGFAAAVKCMALWAAGPSGPVASPANAESSPPLATPSPSLQLAQGTAAAAQPPAGGGAGGEGQQLVGCVPPQLVALLRQLAESLTADVQAAPHRSDRRACLKACTRALKMRALRWVSRQCGV